MFLVLGIDFFIKLSYYGGINQLYFYKTHLRKVRNFAKIFYSLVNFNRLYEKYVPNWDTKAADSVSFGVRNHNH